MLGSDISLIEDGAGAPLVLLHCLGVGRPLSIVHHLQQTFSRRKHQ